MEPNGISFKVFQVSEADLVAQPCYRAHGATGPGWYCIPDLLGCDRLAGPFETRADAETMAREFTHSVGDLLLEVMAIIGEAMPQAAPPRHDDGSTRIQGFTRYTQGRDGHSNN